MKFHLNSENYSQRCSSMFAFLCKRELNLQFTNSQVCAEQYMTYAFKILQMLMEEMEAIMRSLSSNLTEILFLFHVLFW